MMKATPKMRNFIQTVPSSLRHSAVRAADRAFFDAYNMSIEMDIDESEAIAIGEAAAIDTMKNFL
jgi:hypothetical protein